MAFHIKNLKLAGQKAILGVEHVVFDAAGIAKVESEKLYKELLTLPNFLHVGKVDVAEVEKVAEKIDQVATEVQEVDGKAEQSTEKAVEATQEEAPAPAKAKSKK